MQSRVRDTKKDCDTGVTRNTTARDDDNLTKNNFFRIKDSFNPISILQFYDPLNIE